MVESAICVSLSSEQVITDWLGPDKIGLVCLPRRDCVQIESKLFSAKLNLTFSSNRSSIRLDFDFI